MEKSSYIVNYRWNCVSNYVYSTILVIAKIYIFLFLHFTSGLLLIMLSQSASIAWKVTSTAALYHCWSSTEHSDLWIKCIVYIWYLHSSSLRDMRIYLIIDLINVNVHNLYACLILLIQLWATKINIVLFLSSLMLRKTG